MSLYVDERTSFLMKISMRQLLLVTKKVRTVGDKWMVLQANLYGTNSQPYYVLLTILETNLLKVQTIKIMVLLINLKIG